MLGESANWNISHVGVFNLIVTIVLAAVLVVLPLSLVFMHSYERNRGLHGRAKLQAIAIAFAAVWAWPVTLAYWWKGPTPERGGHKRSKV
jgi:hypothetical protein